MAGDIIVALTSAGVPTIAAKLSMGVAPYGAPPRLDWNALISNNEST